MRQPFVLAASILALGIAASDSATAQSTAQSNAANRPTAIVRPFSPAEKAQGAQSHTQILSEFGGVYAGPQAQYVTSVGQGIAVQSGLSSARSDFTVTLLNSPVNNAFALPGGYIYVTRQLMALMNNEAELAGVLGHEVGHTAARHAKSRQRAATRNTILGVLGQVAGGLLGDNGGLIGTLGSGLRDNALRVAQLATLGYSRGQETEADDLGIRYLNGAGYDPAALATVLASLAAQNSLDQRLAGQDGQAIPEWASTHPDPASRVQRALTRAQALRVTNGRLNRDGFLTALDNVLYGDDPRQGVVEGDRFIHPDFRLAFTAAPGFVLTNSPAAVSITPRGSGAGAAVGQGQFLTAAYNGDLDSYVRAAFAARVGDAAPNATLDAIQRTSVNGIPAAYASALVTGQSQGRTQRVVVTIFAYEFARDRAFHFATLSADRTNPAFETMFASMQRLSASEATQVRPRRIDVVIVGRRDTMQSLAARMAYPAGEQMDRFMVLNGLVGNAVLTPGQRVKLIVSAAS